MSKQKTLQKVSIVFEEVPEDGKDAKGNKGPRFNVYLEGHTRNLQKVNPNDLSPAEFWASKCFMIVTSAITQAGAVESVRPRPDGGVKQ